MDIAKYLQSSSLKVFNCLYKKNKIFCYDNEMKNGVFW